MGLVFVAYPLVFSHSSDNLGSPRIRFRKIIDKVLPMRDYIPFCTRCRDSNRYNWTDLTIYESIAREQIIRYFK